LQEAATEVATNVGKRITDKHYCRQSPITEMCRFKNCKFPHWDEDVKSYAVFDAALEMMLSLKNDEGFISVFELCCKLKIPFIANRWGGPTELGLWGDGVLCD
jgi:hypothetical protein